jgi:hypothetical protein
VSEEPDKPGFFVVPKLPAKNLTLSSWYLAASGNGNLSPLPFGSASPESLPMDSICPIPYATIRFMNINLEQTEAVEIQAAKNENDGIQTKPSQIPVPSTIQFQEIAIGQYFEFRGRRYKKLALSMASDEDRIGTIFQAQTEVLPDPFHSISSNGSQQSKSHEPEV